MGSWFAAEGSPYNGQVGPGKAGRASRHSVTGGRMLMGAGDAVAVPADRARGMGSWVAFGCSCESPLNSTHS